MLILAVDTTLAACSAALLDSSRDAILAQIHEPMQKGHAERLAEMARDVAVQAGVDFSQLDRIAVTTGPGTFTGVRIGIAMARGVARALGIPVVGISTLQAIAGNAGNETAGLPVSVVMDARRGAVYTQTFSAEGRPIGDPRCVALTDLVDTLGQDARIVIGSGVALIEDAPASWHRSPAAVLPDAGTVARLAQGLPDDGAPPVPLYLRPADAKPQAAQVRLARQDVEVVPGDAGHAEVIAALHGECFTKGWSAAELAQMLALPGMEALLAMHDRHDGEPAGFIMVRRAADEAEIITLCVRPGWRRRGIAVQMLQAASDRLKTGGVTRLFLEVDADNAAARALYAGAGFAETGLRTGYYALDDGSRGMH